MLRGPGRRRPVGRGGATPRGRNSGGGVQPADPERVQEMMEARVTEVVDPASFWAQVGDGRRAKCLRTFILVYAGKISLMFHCMQTVSA